MPRLLPALAALVVLIAGLLAQVLTASATVQDVGLVLIVGSLAALASLVPGLIGAAPRAPAATGRPRRRQ